MIQSLIYIATSQSLQLQQEGGFTYNWTGINSLIVSSSGEIVAFSGSTLIASFPTANTNLYYDFPPINTGSIPPSPSTGSSTVYCNFILNSGSYVSSDLSASIFTVYVSSSLSQSTYLYGESSTNNIIPLLVNTPYIVFVSGSLSASYSASLYIYDQFGSIIFSGSKYNTPVSTSFTASLFQSYTINAYVVDPKAL